MDEAKAIQTTTESHPGRYEQGLLSMLKRSVIGSFGKGSGGGNSKGAARKNASKSKASLAAIMKSRQVKSASRRCLESGSRRRNMLQ